MAVSIDEKDAARIGRQRPVAAVRRNGVLVKPNLQANDDKLTVGRSLSHLRADGARRRDTGDGIANMTINLAKVFPAARWQYFFAARQRDAAEQKRVARNNCQSGAAANARVPFGTTRGTVEQKQEANSSKENRAEK